jgi:hypothetical protein
MDKPLVNESFKDSVIRTNEAPVGAFGTGAVRQKKLTDQYRFDLLDSNDEAMRRLAATFADGFMKYGADNWKKGFPASDLYAHAREHMLLWICGDKSEDHLAHACWNLMTIMWMEKNRPEMMDFPSQQKG